MANAGSPKARPTLRKTHARIAAATDWPTFLWFEAIKRISVIEELAALAILFGFDHAPLTNKARAVFFDANNDIFDEEVFVATLDSHTTPICRATDGTR